MVASDYLRDARIVVVGAGVVGAAVAYRLAQAGAAVTIVERRRAGAGMSGATFAYVNATDKPPRPYHRMSMLAIRDHEDLADELGGDWLHVTGSLHWASAADRDRASALDRTMRQLLAWGARADRLGPETVTRDLEPDLRIDPATVEAVWRVDRAGWLDPVALAHGAISAAVRRYGARSVRGEVVGLPREGGAIAAVLLGDGGRLAADVVVNAAGPDAAEVAALAGARLPLERTPGVLFVTAPAPVRLGHVAYGPEVNLRPDGGACLMLQRERLDTGLLDGAALTLGDPRVDEALEHARAIVPGLAGVPVETVRHGVRPMPRDGYPIVGFDPGVANLYHVVTHSGVTLEARLGLLVTEELTGGDVAPLEAYRPSRFGGAADG
jgi:glycine/D-amino acid oxidase-like deaminating enzyme